VTSSPVLALGGEGPPGAPKKPLALVVDITGHSPEYDAPLCHALSRYPEVRFRTSRVLTHWAVDRKTLAASGLQMDFLGGAAWLADRWPGVTERPALWKLLQLQGYLRGWRDISRALGRDRVPVLHLQWCRLPSLDLRLMRRAQARGTRVVYTVHNALPHDADPNSVRHAYAGLYRQADALVVLSRFVGAQVVDHVDASVAKKIHVIEPGVYELGAPLPDRVRARAELGLEPSAEVALFMGGISPYKGVADLIEAAAIARHERPALRVVIAGIPRGPMESYVEQIRRLELEGTVRFNPRFVSQEGKAALYAAADVAVLPHRLPSQSGMGLEALGAGRPIIATRAGGLAELVAEGQNGYTVPAGDPGCLAGALARFFALPPSQRTVMADASRALGRERFAWTRAAEGHLALYRRLALGSTG
jgi:glycosyltransferase involved in cell wall biosynthesis